MILVDYSTLQYGALHQLQGQVQDVDIFRHMVLNSIRMYNKKYRNQYGQMVLAIDSSTWRKNEFPQYKGSRKKGRADDAKKWEKIFSLFNQVVDELKVHLPYPVVQVKLAEADDIIGTMAEKFHRKEKIMIVSGDKDFGQLQRYPGVRQFSPVTKKEIKVDDPEKFLFDHFLTGDATDGIPNFRSPDTVFLEEGARQKPVSKKLKETLWENRMFLQDHLPEEEYKNFKRNEKMIDLTHTPDEVKRDIISQYEECNPSNKPQFLNYLMKNRCKQLINSAGDF